MFIRKYYSHRYMQMGDEKMSAFDPYLGYKNAINLRFSLELRYENTAIYPQSQLQDGIRLKSQNILKKEFSPIPRLK